LNKQYHYKPCPAQGLASCALFSQNSFQLLRSGQYLLFNAQPPLGCGRQAQDSKSLL